MKRLASFRGTLGAALHLLLCVGMLLAQARAAQPGDAVAAVGGESSNRPAGARPTPSVRVSGNHLVDADGMTLQLRGVNASGLEFYPVANGADPDLWGGQHPRLDRIQSWGANALRVPLGEQSYLGQTCYQFRGGRANPQSADARQKYRAEVKSLVDEATRRGMYVILDLHKNAPPGVLTPGQPPQQICPISSAQQEMADAANGPAFWSAVATDYRTYPNVIFDLFNEPHVDNFVPPAGVRDIAQAAWTLLRDGGQGKVFYGNDQTFQQPWAVAGMQSLLDAVRATGANNVVMVAGLSWSQDNSRWLRFVPVDRSKQLALSWHAYPKFGAEYGSAEYTGPAFGDEAYRWAESILQAGYPIIIGETGDHSAAGTPDAPFLARLLPWADAHSVSVMGWGWNAWGAPSANLIKDAQGTPTDGYGVAFKRWLQSHR